jgi:hypothetical protein
MLSPRREGVTRFGDTVYKSPGQWKRRAGETLASQEAQRTKSRKTSSRFSASEGRRQQLQSELRIAQ